MTHLIFVCKYRKHLLTRLGEQVKRLSRLEPYAYILHLERMQVLRTQSIKRIDTSNHPENSTLNIGDFSPSGFSRIEETRKSKVHVGTLQPRYGDDVFLVENSPQTAFADNPAC